MNLIDTIEEKAMTDGRYAIAWSLLKQATAQKETADALDRLGFNHTGPENVPGCLEKIAMLLGATP